MSEFISPSAPFLILAGDICRIQKLSRLSKFLEECSACFKTVFYILGNHELYYTQEAENLELKGPEELVSELTEAISHLKNVHILNRKTFIVGNVCLAGCTLWSYFTDHIPTFRVKIKGITTEKYNRMHSADLAYLENTVKYAQEKGLKLLVVTHYPPSHSVGGNRVSDNFRGLYYNNLDFLFGGKNINTWIYGHVHNNKDIVIRGTRLVGNQRGRKSEKIPGFLKNKVVSL